MIIIWNDFKALIELDNYWYEILPTLIFKKNNFYMKRHFSSIEVDFSITFLLCYSKVSISMKKFKPTYET